MRVTSSSDERGRLSVETVDIDDAARIVIRGEADIANAHHLAAALDSISLDGAKRVQLQVSDLAFIDVSTLRHLTAFATRLRQEGRTVETRGARPMLQHMVRELEVDGVFGFPGQGPTTP
jgi:anti-anti-sigma factor